MLDHLEPGEVAARTVMTDQMRLAIDGYQLIDDDTDGTLGLAIRLVDGQNHFDNVRMFSAVRNKQGQVDKDLHGPLLQAMTHFLNAGGDPADLKEYADDLAHCPKLNHKGYELAGIFEDVVREVYYITKDERVVRVFPGITWEYVSQEELEEQHEEDSTGFAD